jgi:MFS family permease
MAADPVPLIPSPAAARPLPVWAAAAAGALSLAAAMGIGRFSFTPMLPLMIQAGQLDLAAGGWLAAANYAGYLAGAMLAPRLRASAPRTGAASLFLIALLTAAMAWPAPVAAWAVLRFLAGMGSAVAFVATSVWCLSALERLGRPDWGGRVYAGVGAGIALAGGWCLLAAAGTSAPGLWLQLGGLSLLMSAPMLGVMSRLRAPPGYPAAARAPAAPTGPAPPGPRRHRPARHRGTPPASSPATA